MSTLSTNSNVVSNKIEQNFSNHVCLSDLKLITIQLIENSSLKFHLRVGTLISIDHGSLSNSLRVINT